MRPTEPTWSGSDPYTPDSFRTCGFRPRPETDLRRPMPEKTAGRSAALSLTALVESAAAEAEGAEELASQHRKASSGSVPRTLPLRRLRVRPGHNPRKTFHRESLEELAETVAEGGIVQPLAVEPDPESGDYWVLQGERRYRALGLLVEVGRIEEDYPVPVYVRTDLDDEGRLVAALVENLQRKELNPVEEAESFATLRDEYGRSTAEIARVVGRTRRHVQLRLQLLTLSPQVRLALLAGELPATAARVLAGAPEELQDSALEHYRKAPASLQNEPALRRHMRARLVPLERALFPVELYAEEHAGPIWTTETGEKDPGDRGRYFADPELFLRLQREAFRRRREELRDRYEWVETVEARRLPERFEVAEGGEAGPGAVILVKNGLYDVEVIEGVQEVARAVAPVAAEAPAVPRSAPAPSAPTKDDLREPPTATRLARAGRLRTRALQEDLAKDPVAAMRAAIVSLVTGGPSLGLRLNPGHLRRRPEAPPTVARGLHALAHALGVESLEAVLDPDDPERVSERDLYHRLLATPRGALVKMFAALVAATLDSGSAAGGEATVESPDLAFELAQDLEAQVTDWKPSVKYFAEYSLEELRGIGARIGVKLPASIAKERAVDLLLASDRIGEYSPPELLYRPPELAPSDQ